MLEEFNGLNEMVGAEVLPELYQPEEFDVKLRLERMLAPVSSKKRMLAINMVKIDQALASGNKEELCRLVKERKYIGFEWVN